MKSEGFLSFLQQPATSRWSHRNKELNIISRSTRKLFNIIFQYKSKSFRCASSKGLGKQTFSRCRYHYSRRCNVTTVFSKTYFCCGFFFSFGKYLKDSQNNKTHILKLQHRFVLIQGKIKYIIVTDVSHIRSETYDLNFNVSPCILQFNN